MPYGTQLSLWEDYPSAKDIVFSITQCVHGCPFDGVYEAKDKGTTVFFQQFGRDVMEPSKYLLAVRKDFSPYWSGRMDYYIANDQWEAFAKIRELTGRNSLWRNDQYLPSNAGGGH